MSRAPNVAHFPPATEPERRGAPTMRLCRFRLDDVVLSGFFGDDHVIPIDQAAECFGEEEGHDLPLPATSDLLNLLPPDGITHRAVLALSAWVEGLDVVSRGELAIPVE